MGLKPKPFENSDEAKEPHLKRCRNNATYSNRNNRENKKKKDDEESISSSKHIVFDEDVSKGIEVVPVSMVNDVDCKKVPVFRYITRMIYPKWCNPVKGPYVGCNCTGECSDSVKCFCALKNEGKIPFDKNKAIRTTEQDIIYECGPYCKCSSSCRNRVSQYGIKFKLQIFKTKKKGWGVRSHNRIPAGSFVCEYLGEIIDDEQAVKMIDNDQYLFNLGNDLNGDVYGNYTINADHYGNVARFINHSCSPNLFCQRVLYDHDDGRIPHMMLFAAIDIPKMQELTLDYHYEIDQVIDSNGKVKKKKCYCGALECCGRLY
jgi:euchromatic histone-lysine N-methyltransferase